MLRVIFLAVFCLVRPSLQAQNTQVIDSLLADLAARPKSDLERLNTLTNLWNSTVYSEPEVSLTYIRKLKQEALALNNERKIIAADKYMAISFDYLDEPDSSFYYNRKAMAAYERLGNGNSVSVIAINVGMSYMDLGELDSVKHYMKIAADRIEISDRTLEHRSVIASINANVQRQQGEFQASIVSARESYQLAEAAGNYDRMAEANDEIAKTYQELGEFETAIEYLDENLAFYQEAQDPQWEAWTLNHLAECFQELGRTTEAMDAIHKAIELAEAGAYTRVLIDDLNVLGNIFRELGDYPQAEVQLQRAADLAKESEYVNLYSASLTYLADAQLRQGHYPQARQTTIEALSLNRAQQDLKYISENLKVLAEVESQTGNYRQAYIYLVEEKVFHDSLYRIEIGEKVAEFALRFEREKQDRLISEQVSQLALLESNARVQRLQRIALIGGLLALLILLGAAWYSYRQRHQRQEIEKARLGDELKNHQKELSAHALQMVRKGQLLDQLGEEIRQIKGERPNDRKKLNSVLRELGSDERIDQDWDNFRTYFQGVHGDFEKRLQSIADQNLSPRELRLAALIKMQLNNQEVGSIMSVTQDSLYKAKYRLRKKFSKAGEGELDGYLRSI